MDEYRFRVSDGLPYGKCTGRRPQDCDQESLDALPLMLVDLPAVEHSRRVVIGNAIEQAMDELQRRKAGKETT